MEILLLASSAKEVVYLAPAYGGRHSTAVQRLPVDGGIHQSGGGRGGGIGRRQRVATCVALTRSMTFGIHLHSLVRALEEG
jgi:hypothetical protein